MKIRLLKTQTKLEFYNKVADNLDNYRNGNFDFLNDDLSRYFEIDQQLDLDKIACIRCEKEDDREAENCENMFSALSEMTPYLARDERFWIYLTHTYLLNYSRNRWPIPDENEKAVNHIRTHFFVNGVRGIERDNAASRLWWMAYISSQCETLSLQEALRCFLYRSDVRANIIERPTTSQNTMILSAILEKLNQSYHGNQKLFDRKIFRNFMIELNVYGGVRLLDSLDKNTIDSIVTSLI